MLLLFKSPIIIIITKFDLQYKQKKTTIKYFNKQGKCPERVHICVIQG